MTTVVLDRLGVKGLVKDSSDYSLPPDVWSDAYNVRFVDDKVLKIPGNVAVFGTPTVTPYWAMPVLSPTQAVWVYSNKLKMYVYDGSTHSDITRTTGGDYGATDAALWNMTQLSSIPIFNNGIDDPQYWAMVSGGTPLAPLTNWPANTKCKRLIAFKDHLVALNVTASGSTYNHRVKWSAAADPGTLPATWDISDATKDAGEVDLSDVIAGSIVDGLVLGDLLIVYKQRSVWSMQYVGGQSVFRFRELFNNFGAMASDCTAVVPIKKQHLVYTGEDLLLHNTVDAQSVIDKRMRRFLLNNIDATNYERSFMVSYRAKNEIWFCFPEVGQSVPSMALVWNWQNDTIAIRELRNINWIATGPVSGTVDISWENDAGSWDVDTELWDVQQYRGYQFDPLLCDISASRLLHGEQTEQFNGSNFTARVERTGLAIVGRDHMNQPVVDFQTRKLMKRVWPKVIGGPVNVYTGAQERRGAPITWSQAAPFDPDTQEFVAPVSSDGKPISGRLMAIRFESASDVSWELEGYDLDLEVLGNF